MSAWCFLNLPVVGHKHNTPSIQTSIGHRFYLRWRNDDDSAFVTSTQNDKAHRLHNTSVSKAPKTDSACPCKWSPVYLRLQRLMYWVSLWFILLTINTTLSSSAVPDRACAHWVTLPTLPCRFVNWGHMSHGVVWLWRSRLHHFKLQRETETTKVTGLWSNTPLSFLRHQQNWWSSCVCVPQKIHCAHQY